MFELSVLHTKDKRQKPGQSGQINTDKKYTERKQIPAEAKKLKKSG
jgi:hypothetical protein